MDLDLAQVRAFVTAAEELHFGRPAARLFLSQQALSKCIARLEEELGVLLFSRAGHAVELTEAGQRFLPPARRAAAELLQHAGRRGLIHLRDGHQSVGSQPTRCGSVQPGEAAPVP